MNFSDLRSILQYVPQFRGRTFVVAIDGAVIDSPDFSNILLDLAVLRSLNIKVVLVHGAAAQIQALGAKRNVPLSNADVMILSSATGIDRTSWPTRLPQPELVGAAAEATNRVANLSKREREVFGLLASGRTIKQVADSLGRSEKTIEGHRDSIYRKLNVKNRAEIAILAMEAGLLLSRRSGTMN